jgi:type I restriction enzyme M protein
MTADSTQLVQELWRYCNVLRDDGLSYPDYVEQLTYLLFLKMADERSNAAAGLKPVLPSGYDWPTLLSKEGEALRDHYSKTLRRLGGEPGMLGLIFHEATNKMRDPAKLRLLIVDLIDRRDWTTLDAEVQGDAYEGLLEKNAQDTKSGAGQYFTPRPVVDAVVECIRPRLGERILDPACGTGGFLIAAHAHMRRSAGKLTAEGEERLREGSLFGVELVHAVTRLAGMNLLLHGIGPTVRSDAPPPVETADSLNKPVEILANVILTNPPFGKQSVTTVFAGTATAETEALRINRTDFWVSTANKELAFLQHVAASLAPGGRAAIVVPDGVLNASGAAETIRRRLLTDFDVHTVLRLPPGIFYATGVNANVLFFDRPVQSVGNVSGRSRKRDSAQSRKIWIYDLRTNIRVSLVQRRLVHSQVDEFVRCYSAEDRFARTATWSSNARDGRWRSFGADEVLASSDCRLDIQWLGSSNGSRPLERHELTRLADEINGELASVAEQIKLLTAELKS